MVEGFINVATLLIVERRVSRADGIAFCFALFRQVACPRRATIGVAFSGQPSYFCLRDRAPSLALYNIIRHIPIKRTSGCTSNSPRDVSFGVRYRAPQVVLCS